ncbi:hypothetical protein VUN82_18705 [Micrococcaceae bacterium Sec5.1]
MNNLVRDQTSRMGCDVASRTCLSRGEGRRHVYQRPALPLVATVEAGGAYMAVDTSTQSAALVGLDPQQVLFPRFASAPLIHAHVRTPPQPEELSIPNTGREDAVAEAAANELGSRGHWGFRPVCSDQGIEFS